VSPLFGRRRGAGQSPQEEAEEARRDAESLARLEQGHIPLAASERLAALAAAGGDGAFSSDLSVAEFSLLHRLGIDPITMVMGSSIYHVGWQNVYFNSPTEFHAISDAYNEARRLALGRLTEEAQTAGADAVVGVRITEGAYDWAASTIEFMAIGTAVRLPAELRGAGGPVLTDLSGQEFWQLCDAGIRPVGIVAFTSVHYAPATMRTVMAQGGGGMMAGGMMGGSSWLNQELTDYTQGLYDARRTAMRGIAAQAKALDADGIVGVQVRQHVRGHRVARGLGAETEDMIVTLHVIGTAIRADPALGNAGTVTKTAISLGKPLPTASTRAASAGI
jgi:uncharacterized protein YbjQ (UPF0145 family)